MDNQEKFEKLLNIISNEETEPKSKTEKVTVTLPESLIKRIESYARARSLSRSKAIAELVETGINYLLETKVSE